MQSRHFSQREKLVFTFAGSAMLIYMHKPIKSNGIKILFTRRRKYRLRCLLHCRLYLYRKKYTVKLQEAMCVRYKYWILGYFSQGEKHTVRGTCCIVDCVYTEKKYTVNLQEAMRVKIYIYKYCIQDTFHKKKKIPFVIAWQTMPIQKNKYTMKW